LWISAVASREGAGPVHLNASFVEPLVAASLDVVEREPADDTSLVSNDAVVDLAGQRVLCIVGRGVAPAVIDDVTSLGWVVLGDATAQGATPYFDAMVRVDSFTRRARPDVVVRIGGLPSSKVLDECLRQWGSRTIGFTGGGFLADPSRFITERVEGLPRPATTAQGDPFYAALWRDASNEVGAWLTSLDEDEVLNEPLVARMVVAASTTTGAALVVGSSMPVRDVEWWTPPRRTSTYSNRGVNGIDGVVSTILGVGSDARAIGYVGDVTMLHDVSGLVDGLGPHGGSVVLVVSDNGGGGIFSFLPQAKMTEHEVFEQLFGTPRRHDLVAVARAFGHVALRVSTRSELVGAIVDGLTSTGLTVVVAQVPTRDENVEVHRRLNDGVRRLLEASQ
jgi:2-succinyl-5-enolpyruvyl-6-hydroxy-3-cyclohexene-1-carboxylate synthase